LQILERMTSNDRLLAWIGAGGLFVVVVWGLFGSSPSLENRVEKAARTALAERQMTWVEADAQGQKVVLTGAAPDAPSRDAAVDAALHALGGGGLLAGGVTKVMTAGIEVAPVTSPYVFNATLENGRVMLKGVAPDGAARSQILGAARNHFGNGGVDGALSLGKGVPGGVDWGKTISASLAILGDLQRGEVDVIDNRMTISGFAETDAAAAQARQAIANIGSGLDVTSDIVGPPEWTALWSGGKLSYAGKVGSSAAKGLLAGSAKGVDLDDKSAIGGRDDWSTRVRAILPHFLKFRSGEIIVQGKSIRVSGEAPGSVLGYLREDMSRIRDEYAVTYNVREAAPDMTEISGLDLSAQGPNRGETCQEAFARVMANNSILFGVGDAAISRQSGQTLDKLVEVTRQCDDLRIEIQGHTDSQGARPKNIRLSNDRANAVRKYLTTRGVDQNQITSAGYGPDKPVADNKTTDGRAKNRRIEFVVSSPEPAR
jgi:OOP family OmpA-OmpF porin